MESLLIEGVEVKIPAEDDFPINEDAVNEELCRAGKLLSFYGDLAARARAEVGSKKDHVDYVYAMLATEVRAQVDKATEGKIREAVLQGSLYRQAKEDLLVAERNFNRADNLWRSMQKRVDCLTALAYQQRQEMKTY